MTQDNKIWHKPDEKLPTDKWPVVFIVPNASPRVGHFWICADVFQDFHTDAEYASNVVNQWAYLDDLVASSKALDVAIGALKEIIPEHEGFLDNEMYACSGIASRALIKIKEIMKGGKQ